MITINVTKKEVITKGHKHWNIVYNLNCLDNDVEIINKDFFISYHTGDNIPNIGRDMLERMQEEIDKYKKEQQLLNTSQVDALETYLQNNLVVV